MDKKFYLGLDIGTESVGIAATDENYRLLRAKGKDLWAVRLFDEAQTAQTRRTKRTARRRLQRRACRIDWLQAIFADSMDDRLFFLRLNNSGLWAEDKDEALGGTKFSLFQDDNYTDKEFYRQFPTVFHLRQKLIEGKQKYDLRLYYLAIHHIVKYRGHFLFEGENRAQAMNAAMLFASFNEAAQHLDLDISFDLKEEKDFLDEICFVKGIKDKVAKAMTLFSVDAKNKQAKEWLNLMVGGSAKPKVLFDDEEYTDSIKFKDLSDDAFLALEADYGEDYDLLVHAKAIYDYMRFAKILQNYRTISDAMVAIYDQHHEDLKKLKALLKQAPDLYKAMFRATDQDANYANYVGHTSKKNTKTKVKKCKPEDFFKHLKKVLTDNEARLSASPYYEEIKTALEEENFLPKILNADNGLFPRQINGEELDRILDNLCRDYPQFALPDTDGYIRRDKILSIFRYRIPYYVGPLNTQFASDTHGKGNSWMVRKEAGEIRPWNFEDKVDLARSNQAFMRRMTNKCSYLHGKDVLPKCSLTYQRFCVLNQLNKLRIDEQPIDVALKQELFEQLYCRYPVVKTATIQDYLVRSGRVQKNKKEIAISGLDENAKLTMSSYVTLKRILGDFVDNYPDVCEDIILWHTLNTDKNLVEGLIKERYGNVEPIKRNLRALKGLNFKEFGRLSKAFLCELEGGVDDVTGEVYTILGELYNTNKNLNEILFDERYTFGDAIKQANGEMDRDVTYEDIEDLYVSPQARRGIWQALLMTDEYVRAIGRAPDKIFVEVTRNHEKDKQKGKKDRTPSRSQTLKEAYTAAKILDTEIGEALQKYDDFALRQERLFLYFLQRGRCAYTGEIIDLDQINGDMYDVDHIVPRALVKDDSIDNKVLVLREKNKAKSDTYPLPAEFSDQQARWKEWRNAKLMSEKKYKLLTRTAPLDEEDLNGFIARQLVVTNQTVKAVAELLDRKYGAQHCKIVYSKAGNVSDFRDKFDLVKCRETNDLHHARDAYLNVVVGNVYDSTFSSWREYYLHNNTVRKNIRLAPQEEKQQIKDAEQARRNYNLKTLFEKDNPGVWRPDADIATVKTTVAKHSMIVTRYAYICKDKFYDETVYGKAGNPEFPRKQKGALASVAKYGGYKSPTTAFFAVVQYDKDGAQRKSIEAIDVMTYYKVGTDKTKLQEVLCQKGLQDPQVQAILKIKTLLSINGTYCYLAGKTGDQLLLHNAVEWYTNAEQDKYYKSIAKLLEMRKNGQLGKEAATQERFDMHVKRNKEVVLTIDKAANRIRYDEIRQQLRQKVYAGLSAPKNIEKLLQENEETFDKLTTLEQCVVLMQLVKFLQCNANTADLRLVGGKAVSGRLYRNKSFDQTDIVVIDRSPCGLIERVRKL